MERTADSTNGVPADRYGSWCPHGKRIMVPDPADTSDYPVCVFADPWPCDQGCTRTEIARPIDEDEENDVAERWAEYYDIVAEGLYGPRPTYYEYDPAG